jgi:crossover junction endodeoxyribonuclease RuvC
MTGKKYDFLVAFDPSLDGCGWAVLDIRNKKPKFVESGVVTGRTTTWASGTPHSTKLALICSMVEQVMAKYQVVYHTVYLERGFSKFNNSTQATFKARGALESKLVGYEVLEITPGEVKKLITGNGAADKEEVATHIRRILAIPDSKVFSTDDESDAVAVAYAGYLKDLGGMTK